MKIQQLTISGFRGFNDPCELLIHDRLTIIYGPNSHGKTSISEALEWLLFERTSKVKGGDYSKEEYKGSYRNAHLPSTRNPFVEAVMVKDGVSVVYKSHLEAEEKCTKFCDGQPVNTWPFTMQENDPGNPFILQHSLKELLLTKPDDRFQGFARLMGLDVLEQIQANIISLCTKPKLPLAIEQLLTRVKALEDRLEARPALAAIAKAYKKPGNSLDVIYKVILAECEKRVPAGTPTNDILPQLLRIRDEGRSKVFKATLSLPKLIADDRLANTSDEQLFLELISQDFIRRYLTLANLAAVQHLLDKAKFFDVGIQLLQADPQRCPFCGREMDEELTLHIGRVHTDLKIKQSSHADLEGERRQIGRVITSIKDHLGHYRRRLVVRCSKFLAAKDSLPALNGLLGTTQASHYSAVESAVVAMEPLVAEFEAADIGVTTHLQQLEASLAASNESDSIATAAGTSLIRVVSAGRALATAIDTYAEPVLNADRIVKYELDKLAGTEDATVLIDLQSQRDEILKKSKINATVEGLREMRRAVDQHVAKRMQSAISGTLTEEVMDWYGQIRTSTDPDVHFDGFDIPRTAKGELRARRVQINAKSYGKQLVSAISCLSESKLNALGLCVSIATNLREKSVFDFLIIDDPIQSWDGDHEVQFVEVLRKLVERGKQIVLLSHNRKWVEQVKAGCRSINGYYYEIHSYTESGPHLRAGSWERWDARLKEVDAIIKDTSASEIKLQQAEQEIRFVVCELTSLLYFRRKAQAKDHHGLNHATVRKMLTECGVESGLIDRIASTFVKTDDAHHAPIDYAAARERIKKYHGWSHELAALLK